jgi:GH24 family phage-related lysozyme (muramidase)
MKVTTRIALELASHEALVRQAYRDSVGVLTWSVGITSASGHSVERYVGNPQPLQKCLEVWLWVMEKYADDVRKAFAGTDLTEAQFGAALSFHYNTGAIKKASWVKKWKAGDVVGAKKSFMQWRKPKEIIPRRKAERDLFFDGVWSNKGAMTEYTRVTKRGTPDWGSAKRIDVSADISAILYRGTAPEPVAPPPDYVKKPSPAPAAKKRGGWLSWFID